MVVQNCFAYFNDEMATIDLNHAADYPIVLGDSLKHNAKTARNLMWSVDANPRNAFISRSILSADVDMVRTKHGLQCFHRFRGWGRQCNLNCAAVAARIDRCVHTCWH